MQWSGGAGSAGELGREHPALGRPQQGYRAWMPEMDDRSPDNTKTHRDSAFHTIVHMFFEKGHKIYLQRDLQLLSVVLDCLVVHAKRVVGIAHVAIGPPLGSVITKFLDEGQVGFVEL